MSPSAERCHTVALVDVSDDVLEALLAVAIKDADADEVTPPLGRAAGWNPERVRWFREYHHAAAAGLDGPAHQQTWAISWNGQLAGSIRLSRQVRAGRVAPWDASSGVSSGVSLETGIWLGRSFRGRGIGTQALQLVKAVARALGADTLEADTTAGNSAAQALLRSAGATVALRDASGGPGGAAGMVQARILLG